MTVALALVLLISVFVLVEVWLTEAEPVELVEPHYPPPDDDSDAYVGSHRPKIGVAAC